MVVGTLVLVPPQFIHFFRLYINLAEKTSVQQINADALAMPRLTICRNPAYRDQRTKEQVGNDEPPFAHFPSGPDFFSSLDRGMFPLIQHDDAILAEFLVGGVPSKPIAKVNLSHPGPVEAEGHAGAMGHWRLTWEEVSSHVYSMEDYNKLEARPCFTFTPVEGEALGPLAVYRLHFNAHAAADDHYYTVFLGDYSLTTGPSQRLFARSDRLTRVELRSVESAVLPLSTECTDDMEEWTRCYEERGFL